MDFIKIILFFAILAGISIFIADCEEERRIKERKAAVSFCRGLHTPKDIQTCLEKEVMDH